MGESLIELQGCFAGNVAVLAARVLKHGSNGLEGGQAGRLVLGYRRPIGRFPACDGEKNDRANAGGSRADLS
jgi:hypothetical protein